MGQLLEVGHVHGHERAVIISRVGEDEAVGTAPEADLGDVLRVDTVPAQLLGENRGQLLVDEQARRPGAGQRRSNCFRSRSAAARFASTWASISC